MLGSIRYHEITKMIYNNTEQVRSIFSFNTFWSILKKKQTIRASINFLWIDKNIHDISSDLNVSNYICIT